MAHAQLQAKVCNVISTLAMRSERGPNCRRHEQTCICGSNAMLYYNLFAQPCAAEYSYCRASLVLLGGVRVVVPVLDCASGCQYIEHSSDFRVDLPIGSTAVILDPRALEPFPRTVALRAALDISLAAPHGGISTHSQILGVKSYMSAHALYCTPVLDSPSSPSLSILDSGIQPYDAPES